MKIVYLMASSLFFMAITSLPVWADDAWPSARVGKAGKPCQNIREACRMAGFARENKEGKAIWKDCMKPLLTGQSVAGVTTNPNDLKACQAKKAARDARRANAMPAPAQNPVPQQ